MPTLEREKSCNILESCEKGLKIRDCRKKVHEEENKRKNVSVAFSPLGGETPSTNSLLQGPTTVPQNSVPFVVFVFFFAIIIFYIFKLF
jgi:hypothetical protein